MLGVIADGATDYRPLADDDRYVRNALRDVNRYDGDVFVKTVPLAKLSEYGAMVNDLGVNQTPSIVVIDRDLKGRVLDGYVDRIAINQVIADARADSISPKISDAYLRDLNAICGQFETRVNRVSFPTIRGKKVAQPLLPARRQAHPHLSRQGLGPQDPGQVPDDGEALRRRPQDLGAPQQGAGQGRHDRHQEGRPARRPDRPRREDAAQARPPVRQGRRHRLRGQPPVVESALVDRERFSEHLAAPIGRGVVLSGGFDGAAGGAVCGDLIRISVRVSGDRVVEASFDASGCGALTAAGSAAVMLVSDALGVGRRPRGRVVDRRGARRALAGEAARRGSGRRRAASRAGRRGARLRLGAVLGVAARWWR